MATLRAAALLLCVLVSVNAKSTSKKKRAVSCDIDESLPCECSNPFLGTPTFYLGDPKRNCKAAKACYVKNNSGCSDARSARGGGRCQSKLACDEGKIPTTPTPPKLPACPTYPPEYRVCECVDTCEPEGKCEVDCRATCSDLSSENDRCFSELACAPSIMYEIPECEWRGDKGKTPVPGVEVTTSTPVKLPKCPPSTPPPGGAKICECLGSCDLEGKCEVDCEADCNDLTSENGKCFSDFACIPTLLFETEECENV